MAEDKAHPGWAVEMRAEEHIDTYGAFITGTKVAVALLVVILALMAIFLL
ncbi:MAG: aa3-type cytochrome c oxidase subunit IV [Parvibaculum sp.]|nr:aa3-type cytochrome c oxidase subunit IV [Parvibaculum sp.]MCE9648756.1 aa3-type cytochrome c oxidase subunit IV [Parvibaculum sp.]